MNVIAITQARTGSTRLPGKVLKIIEGKTLLSIHLDRLARSKRINFIIVATTVDEADNAIEQIAIDHQLAFYRGSINNVLDRYYQAAKLYKPDWVVRVTSDCPLLDPDLVDEIIAKAIETDVDYCSNGLSPTFPDGMDVEVFKYTALEKSWKEAVFDSEKEHVTPYIYNNSSFFNKNLFTAYNFFNTTNYESVRLTVDELADFEVIKQLIEELGIEKDWKTYADHYLKNKIKSLNSDIKRNEGYITSLKKDQN